MLQTYALAMGLMRPDGQPLRRGDLVSFQGKALAVGNYFRSRDDSETLVEIRPRASQWPIQCTDYVGYVSTAHSDLSFLPRDPGAEPELIAGLRREVESLAVDEIYRSDLEASIDRYCGQLLSRPAYLASEAWDDLEALQQVTLSDRVEAQWRNAAAALS